MVVKAGEVCMCGHPFEFHGPGSCVSDCYCYRDAFRAPKAKAVENEIRTFASGATRSSDADKLDYEGFLSPLVLRRFAQYMHTNRMQADGTLRPSDNWQKGLPPAETLKSLLRHVMEVWLVMREKQPANATSNLQDSLCAVIFNAQSILLEILEDRYAQEIGRKNV